jgi:hypothetical protein
MGKINEALKDLDRSFIDSFAALQCEQHRAVLDGPVLASTINCALSNSEDSETERPMPASKLPKISLTISEDQILTKSSLQRTKIGSPLSQPPDKNQGALKSKPGKTEKFSTKNQGVSPTAKKPDQLQANQKRPPDRTSQEAPRSEPAAARTSRSPASNPNRSVRSDDIKPPSVARAASAPAAAARDPSPPPDADAAASERRVRFKDPPPPAGGKAAAAASPQSTSRSLASRALRAITRPFRPSS